MSLRQYLHLFHRGRWWIGGAALVGLLLALAGTLTTAPVYTSGATAYLSAIEGGGEPGQAYQGSLLAEQKAVSYADLMGGRRVLEEVSNEVGVDLPDGSVTATATAGSAVILIQGHSADPALARDISEAAVLVGSRLVSELERPLDPILSTVLTLRSVEEPTIPTAPSSPDLVSNLVAGLAGGLAVGLALVLLHRAVDGSVRTREQLEESTGHPPLAMVPAVSGTRSRMPMISSDPGGAFAEAFRLLRANLVFRGGQTLRSVVVTSPGVRSGASTVAVNLAAALALEGRKVLLVDADLRRAGASEALGLTGPGGLATLLTGELTYGQAVEMWVDGLFDVIPAGTRPTNPTELLGSDSMRSLMSDLGHMYDVVVYDTPAALSATDALLLSARATTTVVVVRHGRTNDTDLRDGIRVLRDSGAELTGAVLTVTPSTWWERRRRGIPHPSRRVSLSPAEVATLGSRRRPRPAATPSVPTPAPKPSPVPRATRSAPPVQPGFPGSNDETMAFAIVPAAPPQPAASGTVAPAAVGEPADREAADGAPAAIVVSGRSALTRWLRKPRPAPVDAGADKDGASEDVADKDGTGIDGATVVGQAEGGETRTPERAETLDRATDEPGGIGPAVPAAREATDTADPDAVGAEQVPPEAEGSDSATTGERPTAGGPPGLLGARP